jgi:hypothetical protein
VLGVAHEARRQHEAARRVLPAHQRLDAVRLTGQQVDLGLEDEPELAVLEAAAQVARDGEHVRRRVGLGDLHAAARRAALGQVHRGVGPLDQRGDVLAVLGPAGDAQRRADLELDALDQEGLGERGEDLLADLGAGLGVRRGRQQHGELVAAQARDRVAGAQHAGDPRPDEPQEAIAVVVAQRVVDELEPVEVEEHHDRAGARARGGGHGTLHAIVEQRAVGQTGQDVVQRLAAALVGPAPGAVQRQQRQHEQRQEHGLEHREQDRERAERDSGGDVHPVHPHRPPDGTVTDRAVLAE